MRRSVENIGSIETYGARQYFGVRREQVYDSTSCYGFAGAGFSNQGQGFPRIDSEGNIVHYRLVTKSDGQVVYV
ncbi:hypothetical protein PSDVSF_13820 [Pseudodesulfovibrio sediminis]|uniref:Uncharacterized protein n=1 Tax=Pseudodesulfovibrio sediminis TaxID=2810563 RepID=A0ABM7P5M3_9BACT|nr:hypothetical protein PSDVSF_13820 [Pseudodesulfovibrio sediminis]